MFLHINYYDFQSRPYAYGKQWSYTKLFTVDPKAGPKAGHWTFDHFLREQKPNARAGRPLIITIF